MVCSGGVCESRGGDPIISPPSSSSSSSMSFLPMKSSGPLCSCAPPYCKPISRVSQTERRKQARRTVEERRLYILITTNGFVYITRRKLVQFLVVAKDDYRDVDGTKDREFVGFFEQTTLALQKSAGSCQTRASRQVR